MYNPKPCMEMRTLQHASVNPLNTKTFTGKLQSSAEGGIRQSSLIIPSEIYGISFVKKGLFLPSLIVNKSTTWLSLFGQMKYLFLSFHIPHQNC